MFSFLNNKVPPPVVGLITLVLIWAISHFWPEPVFRHVLSPWIASLFAAIGLSMDLIAMGAFRKARTTVNPLSPQKAGRLVRSGYYRFTRNPMYLGLLMILIGFAIYCGHWAAIFPIAGFVFYITEFQIKPEEKAMTELFGDDYLSYKKTVRRWI